jgi:hypothetical protein
MLTFNTLIELGRKMPAHIAAAEVRAVVKVELVDRGPHEGELALRSLPIVSICGSPTGILVFVSQDESLERTEYLPALPPGFKTGNAQIDARPPPTPERDPGDEWKDG